MALEIPLDKKARLRHTDAMKFHRLIALGVLLSLLVAASASVSAEEGKMNALQTALSSTTISGYVDTSVQWTPNQQPVQSHGFGSWWRSFRIWVRAHGWR